MKKKKIAIFTTGWAAEILYQYLLGLKDILQGEAMDLYVFLCHATFGNSEKYMQGEMNIFDLPDLSDFDAALIFANSIDYPEVIEQIRLRCKEADIPVITTGKRLEDCYFVGSDNYIGTKELAEHLITQHDVKDVWFIAGSPENMDSNTRLQAIKESLSAHNLTLPVENICYSNWVPIMAVNYFWEHYKKTNAFPDAVICANDTLAMVLCSELRQNNIRVPEDIIVTGFDNEFLAQIYDPSISSVDQRFDHVGRRCGQMLLDILADTPCEMEQYIQCEFVPSESCGCHSAKDFNAIRREIGRKKFIDQINNSNFDLKLSTLERLIMQSKSYSELSNNITLAHNGVYDYEGASFHILLDPLFEKTIDDQQKVLRKNGYPPIMDAVYSKDRGVETERFKFETKQLVPINNPSSENRLFIFLPLHEDDYELGYLVFCDDYEKIKDAQMLRKYAERINIILGKFYGDLRVDALHRRLLQMTETDALTRVKNRTAFATRQSELQTKMQSGEALNFAMVVCDVNNLKRVNDNLGHEAGDEYIINCCKMICKTFKKSAIYRIGGDEFVAVLEKEDYEMRETLIEKMNREMEAIRLSSKPIYEKVSVATGLSVYTPEKDYNVADVFNRADARMYERKAAMKAGK